MMGLGHFSSLQYTMKSRCLSVLIKVFFYSDKCNTKIDCLDGSDEDNCHFLNHDNHNHAKELFPSSYSGGPCLVYINVSVFAFPNIDSFNLKFTADFYLNLKWYDPR